MLSAAAMSTLPPLTQLAGNHGALFEGYFQQLDVTRNGKIDASSAAAFLKKTQLVDPVLHKIWELSDPSGRGYLDRQGFYAALRLVAACQLGKEPSLGVITLSDPPPRLLGIDISTIAGLAQKKWTIEAEDGLRYDKMFQVLGPVGGKLSGEKARPVMMASKLPVDVLGKIWTLSDIDRDGQLDAEEFAVAMRLIQLCQAGEMLPSSLPPSIIPPSKKGGGVGGVASLASPLRPSPSPSPAPLTPSSTSPTLTRKQEWVVNKEAKAKYDKYFEGIDKDRDGLVSGEEARGLFMASNLSSTVLAHVWNLCDTLKLGKLNAEQFALAMHLIAEKVRGKELPTELAPNMVPPSLRGKTPLSAPVASVQPIPPSFSASSISSATDPATPSATSLLPSSSSSSITLLPSMTASPSISSAFGPITPVPVPAAGDVEPGQASGGSVTEGFGSDFSAIKELDSLTNEIAGVKNEKVRLQDDIRVKQELIKTRKGEVESLQHESNTVMRQREELEREKGQYLAKLDQLDTEKAQLESTIAEVKQKCRDEQEEIERLKGQLSQQESSKRAQGEELEALRVQLERLKKEEREYKQRIETGKAELEKLQKSSQARQSEMKEVHHKIDRFKEEQLHLNQQMNMYSAAGSTPGSTPSSSVVNINDVGQLPLELNVPHINEPDAASARATAGSSSPVSSISGFSTNSHLEETGEEGSMGGGGGGREDRIPRNDPFAGSSGGSSTASLTKYPFAAFSVPSSDHFSLASGGSAFKPTGLSTFDPFGMADAFKSTGGADGASGGGTVGEDLFKSDLFSSGTASGNDITATDPFSGQDPFSSDPFASTSAGNATSSATAAGGASAKSSSASVWSGAGGGGASLFGLDPFSGSGTGGASGGVGGGPTATTPTDPFTSDPFLEDPFGEKGNVGGEANPFAADSSDIFGSKGWSDSKTS